MDKKKVKTYKVKIKSTVKVDYYTWNHAYPEWKIDLNDPLAPVMDVSVDATSPEEAVEEAKKIVVDVFPQTEGKLSVVGQPSVPTTSESYLKKNFPKN